MKKIIRLYENKEYDKVYDLLKQDSYIKFLDKDNVEYGKSKLLIVFKQYLYISSKKINKDLEFLIDILKKILEEALQEKGYKRFIERERKFKGIRRVLMVGKIRIVGRLSKTKRNT